MDMTPAQLLLLFRTGQKAYRREIVQLATIISIGTQTGFSGDNKALKTLASNLDAEGDGVEGGFRAKLRTLIQAGKVRGAGGPSG